MSTYPHKKAFAFIESDQRDLRFIFSKVAILNTLNSKLINYLDPNMAKYCQVANIIGNKLILIAANGSIATQIRFQANDLIRKFHKDSSLKAITRIECIVRPVIPSRLTTTSTKSMPLLTRETANIIHETAQLIDDPMLRKTMERIANRFK